MTPEQEREATVLMQRAQHGDHDAYASLLIVATTAVRRFIRARWGEVIWIDDAVQETLLSVHRARHTFDPARPFAPWLYAIARNRIIDVARRQRRVDARELAGDELPETASASRSNDGGVDVEWIRAALAALPEKQREVIEGMKLRDESVREVGRRLGMSESAVKITAHRGYKALRKLLGGQDHDV